MDDKAINAIDRFHSRGQQLCKLLGIKESFNMWKEFNSHWIFFVHKHGRRFIDLYTNMAAVTSYENDLYIYATCVAEANRNLVPRVLSYPPWQRGWANRGNSTWGWGVYRVCNWFSLSRNITKLSGKKASPLSWFTLCGNYNIKIMKFGGTITPAFLRN